MSPDCLQEFVASLHEKGMRYVVIVDPGIKVDSGYPAYDRGIQADIFIKDITSKPYLGQVMSASLSEQLTSIGAPES